MDQIENLALALMNIPGGQRRAVAGPRSIRLLEIGTGKELRRFGGRDVRGQSAVLSPDGKYLVAGLESGGIRFWDRASGTVIRDAPAHRLAVTALAFADSNTLVSGSLDGTAIAWDVKLLLKASPPGPVELEALWASLGRTDAEKAAQVMQAFVDRPKETVAFFKGRLHPQPIAGDKRLSQLTSDMQSNQFAVRQRASDELDRLGGQARAALAKLLDAQPPIETRRRIESLLQKLDPPFAGPELIRGLRAVEVLERIGTPEAREVLETLAAGGPGHRLTEDARGAVERLTKQP
jgi:hypothetical protein